MIKELSQEVAEDLCAQQVITSICDCIKELVDNSIDAHSTKITVLLDQYGKQRIRVIDNGAGIENFQFLARKGSTSKNKGNYQEVQTLGFRGQALHSLAKVSRSLTITSCHKSKTVEYNVKQNKCKELSSTRDDGTHVEIESLFQYLPVRRYELLNKYREFLKRIDDMMRQYCVIYPRISFVLRNTRDGKADIILETAAHKEANWEKCWLERVREVLGIKVSENLMYMKTQHVEGWILKNIESGSSKDNAYIRKTVHYAYLNSRPIDSLPKINSTFDEYYKKYNKSTKYIDIVNILLPWNSYDVNLTPNKREILIKEQLLAKVVNQIRQFIDQNVVEIVPVLGHFEEKQKLKMIDRMSNFMKSGQGKNKNNPLEDKGQINSQLVPQKCENKIEEIIPTKKQEPSQLIQNVRNKEPAVSQQNLKQKKVNDISKEIKQRTNTKVKDQSKNNLIKSLNERMSIGSKKITQPHLAYKELGILSMERKGQKIQKSEQIIKQADVPESLTKESKDTIDKNNKQSKAKLDKELKQKIQQRNKLRVMHEQVEQNQGQQLLPQKFSCAVKQESFKQFNIMGQFNHGFIVCLFEDKYYLVDQHAASQKHHFQKLLKSTRNRAQIQEMIELSPVEIQAIEEQRQKLEGNGYRFQIMEQNTILLTQVPVFLGKSYGKQYFLDIASTKKQLNELPDYYNAAATKACRTAVMVGDVLQPTQMKTIVSELSDLQSPWNCPHGRPTLIYLGMRRSMERSVENRQNEYNLGLD